MNIGAGFLRLSLQEQILFAKRLGLLIKAGVPILKCLTMLKAQSNSRGSRHIYGAIITDVQNGGFLHKSMQRFRNSFGEFAVNLVRVGEMTGSLHENLEYLAVELKKKQALRRKVISALVYPVIIVLATFGISGLMVIYVFPKILPIFQNLNFELPWSTKVLIFVSDLLLQSGWYILLGLGVLTAAGLILLRFKKIRYSVHRAILSVPIFGQLSQSYQMANFCRTLGVMLRCNVAIAEAATITAEITNNLVYQKHYESLAEKLIAGTPISQHLSEHQRLFPPILSQMVSVGETAGNLSHTLLYLGEMYENEVDDLTGNLSTIIEPALMIFLGLAVGFIAVSIITPIYGITQNIHP